MSYTLNKNEIVIEGWENGIATSPHKGIANIQAGNISTETGEVMASFNRIQQSQQSTSPTTGTAVARSTSILDVTYTGIANLQAGNWIKILDGITGLGAAYYYILTSAAPVVSGVASITVSATFNGAVKTFTNSGQSAVVELDYYMDRPIASATETYSNSNPASGFAPTNTKNRYYVLDAGGLVWVYDTANDPAVIKWFLPENQFRSGATGIAVLNGFLFLFTAFNIYCKPTTWLGKAGTLFNGFSLLNGAAPHPAFVGHQGYLYFGDGNLIGSIFPETSLLTQATNVQSNCSYTASTTTGTITAIVSGSVPTTGTSTGLPAIPAVFYSPTTKPTDITVGTIYYIKYSISNTNFFVYPTQADAIADSNKVDVQTGSSGTQYFTTFWPLSADGLTTITKTNEKLNLPTFEIVQSLGELGNNIIIGTNTNTLYPWNQIDVLPSDLIPLPEAGVVNMITVNNMMYVFAGNKGNIYLTNGSTASLVLTVPDYCAGVPGTPSSYVEPYFTWGGAMYCRGRVYFSIQDQVSAVSPFPAKAGNCGGVWSFVPTQNFFYGQDTGLALRLENQASYGTYSGYSTVLIPAVNQVGRSPQYWNGWFNGTSAGAKPWGIDFTDTTATTPCVVETDLIPTGTMLDKKTFSQIEYKLSVPLTATESVTIKYRQNSTDAWVSCGTAIVESTTSLSGYFPVNFEKGQWLQLQITLTPNGALTTSSFVRLKSIIIR